MDKIKNIEKKFCLFVGLVGLVLPVMFHISLWSFGFMSGLGLAGWMLLPDKKESDSNEPR